MKDGTVYRSGFHPTPQVIPVYDVNGELLNEQELEEEPGKERVRECYHSSMMSGQQLMEEWSVFHVTFPNYINVDDIEAVYMDGVELPLE